MTTAPGMSTLVTIDKPENPWKKRRKGAKEFMPPSRALLAEKCGDKATATWCFENGFWKCRAAHGIIQWMRGSTQPDLQPQLLKDRAIRWHWIEPNTTRVISPPF